jgi:N-acylglucosamine-6-phosphate 2-epimerase
MSKTDGIKGKLIVSCQALPDEPLHSPVIMGRMALAAQEGGAGGIRANTKEDIKEIKRVVGLPIIGIVKRNYPDSKVYITPTLNEVEELVEAGVEIIAMDATRELRPGNITLEDFFNMAKAKYPLQKFMADCSTLEEAIAADELGFDFVGTTLVGYTSYTDGTQIEAEDFSLIKQILCLVKKPLIAEGNINTPEKARRVLELGCHSVVVGSAITRPQWITKKYTEEIEKNQIK